MLGKLSVVLLLVASAASANEPAPADAPAQEYKIKKVCRTVEVAGSFIPRTHCVNKKVPIKKTEAQSQEPAKTEGTAAEASGSQDQ